MSLVSRVAARYLEARGLDLGNTWENGKVRIHRYSNIFKIWDLPNAGRRGKKVRVMTVGPGIVSTEAEKNWLEEQSKRVLLNASGGYDSLKRYFEAVGADISERAERGVDVFPGDVREIKMQWSYGDNDLRLKATPLEFLLNSSVPLSHPKTGEPMGDLDTLYSEVSRTDSSVFYRWLVDGGESKLKGMGISDIRKLWNQLKVRYDYH